MFTSLKAKKFSNPVAFYVLGAVMAVAAVVAITLIVIKKKKNDSQDATPLNNVDKNVYTN